MSFNAVDAYWDSFKAFKSDRGGLPSSGMKGRGTFPFFKPIEENYPATTWGDVYLFSKTFIDKTDPSCAPYVDSDGWPRRGPGSKEQINCFKVRDFVHTSHFNRARSDWEKWMPQNRVDTFTLASKIGSREIYPYNEAFWGYAKDYAVARNMAGVVEGSWSMAARSVKEAIAEAPARVRDAADAVIPDLPTIALWLSVLKWGSVAAGLGMLYWFVLKPKPKQLRD
jgi:hypothetical protein